MLNNVRRTSPGRLPPDERRRQLIGIGLRMLVERPIQELSVDAVAAEAGISRGLLFHYFATKAEFHDAVLDAALRRTLRNTAPDPGAPADLAVRQLVERTYVHVDRRREPYLALVFGNGTVPGGPFGHGRVESLRAAYAQRVAGLLMLTPEQVPVARGWCAYLEDRAVQWSGLPAAERAPLEDEVAHVTAALPALLAVPDAGATG